ncbi:DUF2512 family protein [Clostridium sp. OS1-26]|uniref:DUF2512 family protein n=1 Tax=Clostridium sp. OS1-26 TaxID=3070681 RepID=UPI0027DEBA07|nr:DUF2512 family protein [Clostridium sp. OS1-26]WML35737.1 DUF2512 family protein [Clostridium sp. OS1-26]
MAGFIIKIIIFPVILLLSNYIFTDISYPYFYQSIFVGVVLAAITHLIDLVLLRPGFLLINTICEFLAAFAVIYSTQFLLPGSSVNLIGALIAATILAIVEFFINRYLLTNTKLKKLE